MFIWEARLRWCGSTPMQIFCGTREEIEEAVIAAANQELLFNDESDHGPVPITAFDSAVRYIEFIADGCGGGFEIVGSLGGEDRYSALSAAVREVFEGWVRDAFEGMAHLPFLFETWRMLEGKDEEEDNG